MISRAVTVALVAAAACAIATGANAAAIPVSPGHGARIFDGRPYFQWALPPNEESRAVYVSTSPVVEAAGEFPESSLVVVHPVGYGSTSWRSSTRLKADDYWWNVRTLDPETHEEFFSEPSNFTVPAALRVDAVRVHTYAAIDELSVYVHFKSNAAETEITAEVRVGSKLVSSKERTVRTGYFTSGSARFEWRAFPSISEGTRLTIRVAVVSADERRVVTRHVRAP